MVVGLSTNDDKDPARPRLFYHKEFTDNITLDPCGLFNKLIFSDLYEMIDNKFLLEHQENIKRWGRETLNDGGENFRRSVTYSLS